MPLDVPAYLTQPAFIENGVKVKAGTNWDFSRGALATPIVALPDPLPRYPETVAEPAASQQYLVSDNIPKGMLAVSAAFGKNTAALSSSMRDELRNLDKSLRYTLVGHADAGEKNGELLSRQRANAVAAQLKRQGYKVVAIRSFGDRRPSTLTTAEAGRVVDVIAVD